MNQRAQNAAADVQLDEFVAIKPAISCGPLGENSALRRAAPLRKYRSHGSHFLNLFEAGAIAPLVSQQPFPAMGQAQPKLSIVLVMRGRGELSALLDLILEKIGRFEHCHHHDKSPAHGASTNGQRGRSEFVPLAKISTTHDFTS
jgi:hypothetical protein